MSLRVSTSRSLRPACSGLMYSGLPLGFEAGDDLVAVHARLDDLQGDAAADRGGLLGDEDQAHAALADLLQQLVRAEHAPRPFGGGRDVGGESPGAVRIEEVPGL